MFKYFVFAVVAVAAVTGKKKFDKMKFSQKKIYTMGI